MLTYRHNDGQSKCKATETTDCISSSLMLAFCCSEPSSRFLYALSSSFSFNCSSFSVWYTVHTQISAECYAHYMNILYTSFSPKLVANTITSLPKVIWEAARVAALLHTYAVKSPLVTMARPKCDPKSTPSRGPIAKPQYPPHPWTRPTYDAKRHPDPIRRFSTMHWTDRRTYRPTERPRESLTTIGRCAIRERRSLITVECKYKHTSKRR